MHSKYAWFRIAHNEKFMFKIEIGSEVQLVETPDGLEPSKYSEKRLIEGGKMKHEFTMVEAYIAPDLISGAYRIHGISKADPRWNGKDVEITTSRILKGDFTTGVFETKNSIYKVTFRGSVMDRKFP